MGKSEALDALRSFRQALADLGIDALRLILYGSHARGEAREDSDIDVVAISEKFAGLSHWERITLLSKAICASDVRIEAVAMTPEEWNNGGSLIADFAREGEEIPA